MTIIRVEAEQIMNGLCCKISSKHASEIRELHAVSNICGRMQHIDGKSITPLLPTEQTTKPINETLLRALVPWD